MTALIEGPFIAVTASLVRHFGPVCAIVLQQIHYECCVDFVGGPLGETSSTQEVLAERTGVSRDQVYRAVKRLTDLGVLVAVKRRVGGSGDHSLTYSVDRSKVPDGGSRGPGGGPGSSRAGAPGTLRAAAVSTVPPETERKEHDPLPPARGESSSADQLAGQLSIAGGVEHRAETKRRNGSKLDPVAEASFQLWWGRYPRAGRGAPGSLDRARVAWSKAVRSGLSPAELDSRLDSYRAARARWAEVTGEPCWLLAAPRFIRESEEFDHELSDDEIFSRWNHERAPGLHVEAKHPPALVGGWRDLQAAWYSANAAGRLDIEAEAVARGAARAAS